MVNQQFMNGLDLAKCVQLINFWNMENTTTPTSVIFRNNVLRTCIQKTPFDKLPEKIINEALGALLDAACEPASRKFLDSVLQMNREYDAKDPWVKRCQRLFLLFDMFVKKMMEQGTLSPSVVERQEAGLLFRLV
jgi:hypothetical protein